MTQSPNTSLHNIQPRLRNDRFTNDHTILHGNHARSNSGLTQRSQKLQPQKINNHTSSHKFSLGFDLPGDLQYSTMFPQIIKIFGEDAGFDPETAASAVCGTLPVSQLTRIFNHFRLHNVHKDYTTIKQNHTMIILDHRKSSSNITQRY